ncbi:DUF1592 domain-containing protein [Saccharobesus litoralis]|uniref:DUF1592 domain-containing protein n=1 Tax=Saccharobesus litoralis TaxID=2172099 RepID=UPI00131F43E7|nr:DUF1592 domain-containing protein [Saccharobesus litoralis]
MNSNAWAVNNTNNIDPSIMQFVDKYCVSCHNPEDEEGDLNFVPFVNGEKPLDDDSLHDMLEQLNLSEMPPPDEGEQPSHELRKNIIAQMTDYLTHKEHLAQTQHTILRRLTRYEYKNTLRDLLGVYPDASDATTAFPRDESHHGFTNLGDKQILSDYQLQLYMQAADHYLDQTLVFNQSQPRNKTWHFPPTKLFHKKEITRPSVSYRVIDKDHKYVDIGHGEVDEFWPVYPTRFSKKGVPANGIYKITVAASAVGLDHPYDKKIIKIDHDKPLKLGLWHVPKPELLKPGASDGRVFIGAFDLTEQAKTYEVSVWLPKGSSFYVHWINGPGRTFGIINQVQKRYLPETIKLNDNDKKRLLKEGKPVPKLADNYQAFSELYQGPRVRIHGMRLQGPFNNEWPPKNHVDIVGDTTDANDVNIEKTIINFARKAFRQPITKQQIQPYINFIQTRIKSGQSAELAIKQGLTAILTSPRFLYLDEGSSEQAKLNSYQIATRLSYLLWSSMPDETLLSLAARDELNDPQILWQQTQRMLEDPKSKAFAKYFTRAWLRLDKIGAMAPSVKQYPTYYNDRLETAMLAETEALVDFILQANRPITEFLNSDYSFINDGLAKHYKIDGEFGEQLQYVKLPKQARRGGLLGHASVLTTSANGVDTSPVLRGVWVLESLLGTPTAPPPADVPPIEPDTRGATTIKEQLAKHRSIDTCNDCHAKIDSWGFPLEFYNPIGGLRYKYFPHGIPWKKAKKLAKNIDGHAQLLSGDVVTNEKDLKKQLLKRKDIFAKNLVKKLLTYATGREMTYQDDATIDEIVEGIKQRDYGMQVLLAYVVMSDIFQSP